MSKINPYRITPPFVVSFSGGRSSAFMLHNILDAYDGKLPEDGIVTFSNTGKEMPETLDFVKECGERWGVDIVWLELRVEPYFGKRKGKKWNYSHKVVSYDSASRNGEPFSDLIKARKYTPNIMARFCTQELKIKRIAEYAENKFKTSDYYTTIGLRADEPERVLRIREQKEQENIAPMYEAGHTLNDVLLFWSLSDFDLELRSNNGVTDLGNCDLCFLKGPRKKLSIIQQKPHLAEWWIKQEENGKLFRADQPSYSEMLEYSKAQGELFPEIPDVQCIGCTD